MASQAHYYNQEKHLLKVCVFSPWPSGHPVPCPSRAHKGTGTSSFHPCPMPALHKAQSCYYCNRIKVPLSCSMTLPDTCTSLPASWRKTETKHPAAPCCCKGLLPKTVPSVTVCLNKPAGWDPLPSLLDTLWNTKVDVHHQGSNLSCQIPGCEALCT